MKTYTLKASSQKDLVTIKAHSLYEALEILKEQHHIASPHKPFSWCLEDITGGWKPIKAQSLVVKLQDFDEASLETIMDIVMH